MAATLRYPNPFLRKPTELVTSELFGSPVLSAAVASVDDVLKQEENGAAMAANQVGVPLRFFVTKEDWWGYGKVFINPAWVAIDERVKVTEEEGCLSFPGITVPVSRFKTVVISYCDFDGNERGLTCEDFQARVVQHECDHLVGKLFLDYLNPKLKERVKSAMLGRRR